MAPGVLCSRTSTIRGRGQEAGLNGRRPLDAPEHRADECFRAPADRGRAIALATKRCSQRMNAGLQAVGGRDHRRRAFVDGVNDLSVVDPAEVHRGDREVGMPELPLDDEQRHSVARHLDRVCVSELMRRKAASYSGSGGGPVQLRADSGGRPGATARSGRVAHRTRRRRASWPVGAATGSVAPTPSGPFRLRGACRLFRGGSGSRRG